MVKNIERPTIQRQLKRRGDCRYGLQGLRCHLDGQPSQYRILESYWGETSLMLRILPVENWDGYQAASDAEWERVGGKSDGPFRIVSAAALDEWQEPQGFGIVEIDADNVCLDEKWPKC